MFLGLGTNLGDRADNLRRAVHALRRLLRVDALSAVYQSAAVGYTEQPHFWNMAVRAQTALTPRALLDALKHLERELGREPTFRMGPRLIDIDVLMYNDAVIDEPGLQIPHPRLHERPFVLQPLVDIDPSLRLVHIGCNATDQLAVIGDASLQRMGTAAEVLGADA